mmetsp:Transcript_9417/g.20015  ORF Transcript_9417/g.20015 Transcript_9417/m.20015 type:complete len:203 (+) Transcript_9417:728-1336(+)
MLDLPTLGAPTNTTAGVSRRTAGVVRRAFCKAIIFSTGPAASSLNSSYKRSSPSAMYSAASRAVSAFLALAVQSFPASSSSLRASFISSNTSNSVSPSFFCRARAVRSATTFSNGWSRRSSVLYPLTQSLNGMQSALVTASRVSAPCLRALFRAFFMDVSARTEWATFLDLSISSWADLTTGRRRRPPVLLSLLALAFCLFL